LDGLILAVAECDYVNEPVCAPRDVAELFVFPNIGNTLINKTVVLMFLAAIIVIVTLFVAFRKQRVVPTRFGAFIESLIDQVRRDIAIGVIGPEGVKYMPYLTSLFLFILVGNFFELTPFINFPITSRMAIPLFLSLLTWVIFIVIGLKKQGFGYVRGIIWPSDVPVGLRPLVGVIEFFSTFLIRPFSLAVRLFANLVAGHTMLTLLLVSGVVFLGAIPEIGAKGALGIAWFGLGLLIFLFEGLVAYLQAYIFTLLAAVYIESSIHVEH